MLSIETQEAIVSKAFFDELKKEAGVLQTAVDTFRAGRLGNKIDRLSAKTNVLKEQAQRGLSEMQRKLETVPSYVRADKAAIDEKKRQKTLLGAAAALGLGATGYGYYQYKRDKENGQLTGVTP
jgi:hypothetical protein